MRTEYKACPKCNSVNIVERIDGWSHCKACAESWRTCAASFDDREFFEGVEAFGELCRRAYRRVFG